MANIITENLLSQVDAEGPHHLVMAEIVDHRKKSQALTKDDMWIISHNGNKTMRKTTVG